MLVLRSSSRVAMNQYKRIFLFADSSMRRTPAFDRAVWLAHVCDAQLHIALFGHDSTIAAEALINKQASHRARAAWVEKRQSWLSQPLPGFAVADPRVTVQVVWAPAVQDEMLISIADQCSDLVIKDVQHDGIRRRILLKPLDWHLLRTCPVPLLLVQSLSGAAPKRVFAAVDARHRPSSADDLNDRIIEEASALSTLCAAPLHLVYAFDGADAEADPIHTQDARLSQQQEAFAMIAATHGIPPDRQHFLLGPPAPAFSELLHDNHDDVIVLGTKPHTVMERLRDGKNAEAILDHVPCNVLAIKL